MRSKRGWLAVVLLALAGASCLFHLWAVNLITPESYSDLLPRIVGTRDALQGINPYSAAVTREIQIAQYGHALAKNSRRSPQDFDYPALIVPVLAPFAHFSWSAIRTGFLWLMVPAFGLGCGLWVRLVRPSTSVFVTVMVTGFALCAWPAVFGFRMEQPTMVLFVLLAVAAFALHRGGDWVAGVCMAFALIKPQLSLPLMLWLTVWAVRHRRWRFPAGFAICFAGLWMLAEWMVPGWFMKWVGSIGAYRAIAAPVGEMVFGRPVGLAVTAALGTWSVWLLWGLLESDSETEGFGRAVAVALAASLLVTPMTVFFSFDQVMLVPGIVLIVFAEPRSRIGQTARWLTVVFVAWSYVGVLAAAILEIFHPEASAGYLLPFADFFLPLIVLISLLVLAEERGWSGSGMRPLLRRWKGLAAAG